MSNTMSPNLINAVAGQYELNIKGIFREAWQKVSGIKLSFWGALGCIALIVLGVTVCQIALVKIAAIYKLGMVVNGIKFIGNLVVSFLSVLFGVSIIFLMIHHVDGKVVYAKKVFDFHGMLNKLLVMALISYVAKVFFLFLLMFGLVYSHDYASPTYLLSGLIAIVILVLMFLLLYLTVAWRMAMLLIIEKKLGIGSAIKIAFIAIEKQFFKNIGLLLVIGLFFLVSIIVTLGIAAIWVFPMLGNLNAIWYRQIFGIEANAQI